MKATHTAVVRIPREALSDLILTGKYTTDVCGLSINKEMARLDGQKIEFIDDGGDERPFYDGVHGYWWSKKWLTDIKKIVKPPITAEDVKPGVRFAMTHPDSTIRGIVIQIDDRFALGGLNNIDSLCYNIGMRPGKSVFTYSLEGMVKYLNGNKYSSRWFKAAK